jgi:hypothetical protein
MYVCMYVYIMYVFNVCMYVRMYMSGKRKGKVYPRIGHDAQERKCRYTSILSLASALDAVCGQRHALAA